MFRHLRTLIVLLNWGRVLDRPPRHRPLCVPGDSSGRTLRVFEPMGRMSSNQFTKLLVIKWAVQAALRKENCTTSSHQEDVKISCFDHPCENAPLHEGAVIGKLFYDPVWRELVRLLLPVVLKHSPTLDWQTYVTVD